MEQENKGLISGITPAGVTELSPVTHSLFSSISLSDPRDGRDTLSVRCSAAASHGFYGPALSPRRSLFVRRKPNGFPRDAWCDRLTLNASSGLCSLLLSSPVTPFRSWLLLVLRNFRGGVVVSVWNHKILTDDPVLLIPSWLSRVGINQFLSGILIMKIATKDSGGLTEAAFGFFDDGFLPLYFPTVDWLPVCAVAR